MVVYDMNLELPPPPPIHFVHLTNVVYHTKMMFLRASGAEISINVVFVIQNFKYFYARGYRHKTPI